MQKLVRAHDIQHYEQRLEQALGALSFDSPNSKKNRETILAYIKFRNSHGLSILGQLSE
jgi:hypothetical protein